MYACRRNIVKRLAPASRAGRRFQRAASAEKRRAQSKAAPGSVLRPGATSLCAATSRSGSAVRNVRTRRASWRYCRLANARSGVPSSSTPIEMSLQRSSARQRETPACQALRWMGTNWTSSPSRRTRKWADTRSDSSPANAGCLPGSSRFVNRSSISVPPNSPGGRLIEWRTRSVVCAPRGRSSQFGEATCRASRCSPSGLNAFKLRDRQRPARVFPGAASGSGGRET